MSAVDLAIAKIKQLSAPQAQELLHWLADRKFNTRRIIPRARKTRRTPLSKSQLKKWQDSVRFTTDWEPPRMPDELVKRVAL